MDDPEATAPINATELQRALAAEGCAPIPDDETPTQPDLLSCAPCKGTGKRLVETPHGYRGPLRCPDCKGTGRLEVDS